MTRESALARLVVTGLGVAGPGAFGVAAFERLLAGPPAPVPEDPRGVRLRHAADPPGIAPREARRLTRPALLALGAAREALEGAGVGPITSPARLDPEATGVAVGSGYGSVEATRVVLEGLLERADLVSPTHFVGSVRHDAASTVARVLGLRGPAVAASARRLSFEEALAWSARQLRAERAAALLAVGTDEATPLLALLRARGRLRPSEADVLGEGAAALLLEPEARARAAGREPLARLLAFVSGVGSPAEQAERILSALAREGLAAGEVSLLFTDEDGSERRTRDALLLAAALERGGTGRLERRAVAAHAGFVAAGGALAAAAAVLAVGRGEGAGPHPRAALVVARERDDSFAAFAVVAPDAPGRRGESA